jgi:hypothetical protein
LLARLGNVSENPMSPDQDSAEAAFVAAEKNRNRQKTVGGPQ